MRDVKQEQGLGGDDNWPHVPVVEVQGDQSAQRWTQEGQDQAIKSWQTVAVLEVVPANANFLVGFKNGSNMQFLKHPIQTLNGKFGMRIGDGDAEFFVIPQDLATSLKLRVAEVTTEDNPSFANLPLY